LITGAARRIGAMIARAAAEHGARVLLHYGHSAAEANKLVSEIRQAGGWAETTTTDLASSDQLGNWFDDLVDQWGPIDGLVNNEAVFDPLDVHATKLPDWQRTLDINLTAPFLLSQAFERRLPDALEGRIVNLLDWRALRPQGDHLAYTISKAGLAALTRSLAVSMAPRICVNGVALGAILPPSSGDSDMDPLASVPAHRWASPEEVTDAALFLLACPGYITGEILHVDGGRHLI
ncbi:MAG: SDR family oxidoreductase, partial [Anaerolineaceae bacterium]